MNRRGANNVVATMLIFGIMITSLGVLYSQISPTLLGFETNTTTTNQSFIMQTVANEVLDLSSSTSGTQTRVHIISEDSLYDISRGTNLSISVLNNGVAVNSYSERIGLFTSIVNGSFQPSGDRYLNRIISEDSYVINQTEDQNSYYVSKANYDYGEGLFSLYFRARLSVNQVNNTHHDFTIVFLQMNFIGSPGEPDNPVHFPIRRDEWTLRLKRQNSIVSSSQTISVTNSFEISQQIDGTPGTTYQFPNINDGDTVTFKSIVIPVLFTI